MWELTGRLCPCSTDRKSGRTAIIPGFCKCLRSVRFRGIVVAEPPVHARQASDLVEAFEGVLMLPGFSVLRGVTDFYVSKIVTERRGIEVLWLVSRVSLLGFPEGL